MSELVTLNPKPSGLYATTPEAAQVPPPPTTDAKKTLTGTLLSHLSGFREFRIQG